LNKTTLVFLLFYNLYIEAIFGEMKLFCGYIFIFPSINILPNVIDQRQREFIGRLFFRSPQPN